MASRQFSVGFDCVGTSADEVCDLVLRQAVDRVLAERGGTLAKWLGSFLETRDGSFDMLSSGQVNFTVEREGTPDLLDVAAALSSEFLAWGEEYGTRGCYLCAALTLGA